MKTNKMLIMAVLAGFAFTSCKNERSADDVNSVEMDRMEAEQDTDLRAANDDNTITARIQRNQNLSTFNEGLTRNQINQDLNRNNTGQTGYATSQTGTTTGQAGNATNQGEIGTNTGQTGTETNQGQTGTTTGQTGTATNQGQAGTTTGQTGTNAGQTNNESLTAGQGNYTIFAPTNDAFTSLSENERNEWNSTQNRDRNIASINYLVVEQRITQDDLRQQIQNSNGTFTIPTRQGENLTATLEGNDIVIRDAAGNQARIVESDTEGSNGVIHVIDRVLRPSDFNRNDARTGTNTNTTGNNTGTNNQ